MSNKGFSLPHILIFVVLLFIFLSTGLYLKNSKEQNLLTQLQGKSTSQENKDKIKSKGDRMLEYFLRDNLSEFPKFQAQVSPSRIKRVFLISLKKIDEKQNQGWVVEVDKDPNSKFKLYSYYLLTPILEQELENAMSTSSEASCILDKVQEVGNERILNRDLQEKSGYIVLSSSNCAGYGSADSGSVSVYSIATSKQIKLQGNFSHPGSNWPGVASGNALGILRGVYGVNNPTLIVEYGINLDSPTSPLEHVSLVAYFDLQSGKLKQLIKLD